MFNETQSQSFEKHILEGRFSQAQSTQPVLSTLNQKIHFGDNLFHKILTRSILKPGSLTK